MCVDVNAFCPLQLLLLSWTTKQQHATPGRARHTKTVLPQASQKERRAPLLGAASVGCWLCGALIQRRQTPSSHGAHTRLFNDLLQPAIPRGGQLLNYIALAQDATPGPGAALCANELSTLHCYKTYPHKTVAFEQVDRWPYAPLNVLQYCWT